MIIDDSRRNGGLAQIPVLAAMVLMLVAIPLATKLANQQQDTRNKAAESCDWYAPRHQCPGGWNYGGGCHQVCDAAGNCEENCRCCDPNAPKDPPVACGAVEKQCDPRTQLNAKKCFGAEEMHCGNDGCYHHDDSGENKDNNANCVLPTNTPVPTQVQQKTVEEIIGSPNCYFGAANCSTFNRFPLEGCSNCPAGTASCCGNVIPADFKACSRGEMQCDGGQLRSCRDDGLGFGSWVNCKSGVCADAKSCAPEGSGGQCFFGGSTCDSFGRLASSGCDNCPSGVAACCGEVVKRFACEIGQTRCVGGVAVVACRGDRTGWTDPVMCVSGVCDEATQKCKPVVYCDNGLKSGESKCRDPHTVVRCNDGKMATEVATDNVYCQDGAWVDAAVIDASHIPDPGQCFFGVNNCSQLGRYGRNGCDGCPAGKASCCGDVIPPEAQICKPGERRCSQGMLYRCDDDGLGISGPEPCRSGRCTVDGSGCVEAGVVEEELEVLQKVVIGDKGDLVKKCLDSVGGSVDRR